MAVTSPAEHPPGDLGLRERKKRHTRAALIGAALRLAAERDLGSVTVEEISAAANVSVRTFFNYFRNKEDAVTGGGVIAGERLIRLLSEAPADVTVLAAVQCAMQAEAEAIERNPEGLMLVLTITERSPSLRPQLFAAVEEDLLADLAAAIGRRTGLDPATHGYPGLIAAVTSAAFRHAIFRWHDGGRVRALTELLDEAFGTLAAGLPEPAIP